MGDLVHFVHCMLVHGLSFLASLDCDLQIHRLFSNARLWLLSCSFFFDIECQMLMLIRRLLSTKCGTSTASSNTIPSNPIQDCFMADRRAKSTPESPQNIILAVAYSDKERSQPTICYQCLAKKMVTTMLIMPWNCRIFEAAPN